MAKSFEYGKCGETGETAKSFEYGKCLETGERAKSLEHGKCLETGETTKSVECGKCLETDLGPKLSNDLLDVLKNPAKNVCPIAFLLNHCLI